MFGRLPHFLSTNLRRAEFGYSVQQLSMLWIAVQQLLGGSFFRRGQRFGERIKICNLMSAFHPLPILPLAC